MDKVSIVGPYSGEFTIRDTFDRSVKRNPDTTAALYGDASLTYKELDSQSSQLARALMQRNVSKGNNVVVISPNSLEYVTIYIANAKMGCATAGVGHMLAANEMEKVVQNIGPAALFIHDSVVDKIAGFRNDLKKCNPLVILTDRQAVDNSLLEKYSAVSYQQLLDEGNQSPNSVFDVEISQDDNSIFYMTSGTTGVPKCVVHRHRDFLPFITDNWIMTGKPGETVIVYNSFAWVGGSLLSLHVLAHGMTIVLQRGYNKDDYFQAVCKHKVKSLLLLPQVFYDVTTLDEAVLAELKQIVEVAMYGGSTIPFEHIQNVMRMFPAIKLTQGYGSTEMGFITTLEPEDHTQLDDERLLARMKSAGRCNANSRIRIVDDEGNPIPIGGEGEIIVQSHMMFKHYYNNEEATKSVLRKGWYYTGDWGKIDEDGYLTVLGRKKDMLIGPMGYNIFPSEIEDVLQEHPQVGDVAVVGALNEEKTGEHVVAYIIAKPSEADLQEWCSSRLADYKQPHTIRFVRKFPRNDSGKVLKRRLAEDERITTANADTKRQRAE